VVGLEAAEHENAVDLVLPDLLGNQVELAGGQGPLRAELGASDGSPEKRLRISN